MVDSLLIIYRWLFEVFFFFLLILRPALTWIPRFAPNGGHYGSLSLNLSISLSRSRVLNPTWPSCSTLHLTLPCHYASLHNSHCLFFFFFFIFGFGLCMPKFSPMYSSFSSSHYHCSNPKYSLTFMFALSQKIISFICLVSRFDIFSSYMGILP